MPRIKDIAERANVSIATVSRVFNNSGYVTQSKRMAVLKAAEELGYTPPEKSKRTYEKMANDIVGVVVSEVGSSCGATEKDGASLSTFTEVAASSAIAGNAMPIPVMVKNSERIVQPLINFSQNCNADFIFLRIFFYFIPPIIIY